MCYLMHSVIYLRGVASNERTTIKPHHIKFLNYLVTISTRNREHQMRAMCCLIFLLLMLTLKLSTWHRSILEQLFHTYEITRLNHSDGLQIHSICVIPSRYAFGYYLHTQERQCHHSVHAATFSLLFLSDRSLPSCSLWWTCVPPLE